MPNLVFHQNMRIFGGGNPARNAAYFGAFGGIQAALPVGTAIDVVGYTEITNAGASIPALGGLSAALFGGAGGGVVVGQCGLTALGGAEYIGIEVRAGIPLLSVGRIVLSVPQNAMQLIHDISLAVPPLPAWCGNLPPQATLDYRGLVYVVVTIAGVNVAVGFIHNLFTLQDQRVLVMGCMVRMMDLMLQNPTGPAVAFIGGDFNAVPQGRGHGASRIFPYNTGVATTVGGNLYDYWYSRIPPGAGVPPPPVPPPIGPAPPAGFIVPVPIVYAATQNVPLGMSDHVGISLRIV